MQLSPFRSEVSSFHSPANPLRRLLSDEFDSPRTGSVKSSPSNFNFPRSPFTPSFKHPDMSKSLDVLTSGWNSHLISKKEKESSARKSTPSPLQVPKPHQGSALDKVVIPKVAKVNFSGGKPQPAQEAQEVHDKIPKANMIDPKKFEISDPFEKGCVLS